MEQLNGEACVAVNSAAIPARTRLVVGLGNPGSEYANTRHNLGFLVVDELMSKVGGSRSCEWQPREGLLYELEFKGERVHALKPLTFMNCSGNAVEETVRQLGISPKELLVVCDDLDLEFGLLRLRVSGSTGGHRGLASIVEHLASSEFPRLRVGIGRPQPGDGSVVDYVLSPWTSDQQEQLPGCLAEAVALIERCAAGKIEPCTVKPLQASRTTTMPNEECSPCNGE
ncbi:MAG: aminoacyl-tRNA hydrolase [Victivallales bacterium]|nr:aminoacyl-tRNA hydrolase [Victivallales bacterium]